MHTNYKIEIMTQAEVQIAIDWMREEGWNPGLKDAECFFTADRHGFFAGKLDEELIAVASAVIYDEKFAFCGCYIVKPEYRNQGFGIQLTQARLNYVADRITGIDGVLDMVNKYAEIGYQPVHSNIRYALHQMQTCSYNKNIVPITAALLAEILKYDSRYFPASRPEFLTCWTQQPNGKALAYVENGNIVGYGVIRPCYSGYKIGPLFAESAIIADSLFLHLIADIKSFPILLDIPAPNLAATKLVEKYGMKKVFETIRMYRNGNPNLDLEQIFGITTFELG